MTAQEQLRTLIERHLVHLGERLATVTALLTTQDDALPLAQIVEAQTITHQLKGTAGSMGFPEIGAGASALDEKLKLLKKMSDPIPGSELQAALVLLDALRTKAEAATPATSTLYDVDLSKLP